MVPNGLASTSKITTLELPWTTTNICSSPSIKFPKKSLTITIYKKLHTKAKSTWKFATVCTAFSRQESLPKNNLSVSLRATAIPLFPTHPDYGNTNGTPSPSAWSYDFSIKYIGKEHADHLIQCLCNHYEELKIDWARKCFCGINLNWDYTNRTCNLSMPGYVEQALHKFQHPTPTKTQDSPYPATVKQYGVKVQLTDPIHTSTRLPTHEIKRLQQIISTLLFYGRAVDPTLLTALSELSSAQATATEATKRACHQFLDYCASHPDGSIHYHASNMILKRHRDSSYLNAFGARTRQGGHLYLRNKSEHDIFNGAVLNLAAIMKMVLSSTAEDKFGAHFHNTKEATPRRTTLEGLGHPQPPTPVLVDNSTAVGLDNDTLTQRRSRAIDMCFYWVRDCVNQQQYHVYCPPPPPPPPTHTHTHTHTHTNTHTLNTHTLNTHTHTHTHTQNTHHNLEDYFTKYHTLSHHRKMRKYTSSTLLLAQSSFRLRQHDVLRGCVNPNRDSLTVIRRLSVPSSNLSHYHIR